MRATLAFFHHSQAKIFFQLFFILKSRYRTAVAVGMPVVVAGAAAMRLRLQVVVIILSIL
jgi:hypothetical protein